MPDAIQNIALPPASSVDYTDANRILSYSRCLIASLSSSGEVEYPTPMTSCAQRHIKQGITWLHEVEKHLSALPIGSILPILEMYDFLHLICLAKPAPQKLMQKWWEKAFDAYRNGDDSVAESHLMCQLQRLMTTEPSAITLPQLEWYCGKVASWCDHLSHADSFSNESSDENRRRLTILLSEDLYMLLGNREAATKRRWRHTLASTANAPNSLFTTNGLMHRN